MTEIVWPDSLIQEVADRRCILFLGSGVSASAQAENGDRPKTWGEFLSAAVALVKAKPQREAIHALIAKEQYLVALEAIQSEADHGDYTKLLDQCFNSLRFKPGDLHEIIYNLDARIVVTTNFDKIYEQFWTHFSEEGFKVVHYDDESLGDEIRSDIRLIIKAHGSINNIQKMIFTRAQYHDAKRESPSFYEILRALFLTNTVIFVGCGMQDPDVLLTLEEVKIGSSANKPHYALVRQGTTSPYIIQDLRKSYNVKALEYGPDYAELTTSLATLLEGVQAIRTSGVSAEVAVEPEEDAGSVEDTLAAIAADQSERGFALGDRVFHTKFKWGAVTGIDGTKIRVLFEELGVEKVVIRSFLDQEA